MNILIIGGSRFVGPLLVEQIVSGGHEVTVFNRGQTKTHALPKTVAHVTGDRNDGFNIKQHFDVVIDMCAYKGVQTETALTDLSFDHFIHFGTAAAYRKSEIFPLTETSPLGEYPLWGEYNRGKVACEAALERSGRQFATIRPVYILGPRDYLDRETFIYGRLQEDKPITLPGNGQALIQFVAAKDVAAMLVLIAEKSLTGAFNCCADEVITLKGLVEYMAGLMQKTPHLRYDPRTDGENFDISQFPFANESLVCSNRKAAGLGFRFTPLLEGIKSDFESYYQATLV